VPTIVPLAVGAVVLVLVLPPRIARGDFVVLDLALLLALAVVGAQLVPLQPAVRASLSPAAAAFDRAMRVGGARGAQPLTIDPLATALALMTLAAVLLAYWSARTAFAYGGLRATVRGIAWMGLLLAPLAIVQHAAPLPLLDRVWGLNSVGQRPFGPFVNRNDLAGWLIMAVPLTAGYAVARIESRQAGARHALADLVDDRSIWLAGSVVLMTGGLVFSRSRSGLAGGLVGIAALAFLGKHRLNADARRGRWLLAALIAIMAGATAFTNVGALAERFAMSGSEGLGARLSIWRETWPIVRNFWPVGAGVGSFQQAMLLYQTRSRLFNVSHADNEFLQMLAEGGLPFVFAVACAMVAGVWLIGRQFARDRTPMAWIRAGAVAGLLGLGVQNLVEMTLRVPANGLLFAVLAAIATYEPAHHAGSPPSPV
jgi:O-antigen ligase